MSNGELAVRTLVRVYTVYTYVDTDERSVCICIVHEKKKKEFSLQRAHAAVTPAAGVVGARECKSCARGIEPLGNDRVSHRRRRAG